MSCPGSKLCRKLTLALFPALLNTPLNKNRPLQVTPSFFFTTTELVTFYFIPKDFFSIPVDCESTITLFSDLLFLSISNWKSCTFSNREKN